MTTPLAKKKAAPVKPKASKTYEWAGLNKRGENVNGEINATSVVIAKSELRRQNMRVKTIRRKRESLFKKRQKAITSQDIMIFSRQLATMLVAGIPLVQAIDIVGRGHTTEKMRVMLLHIKTEIESGKTLSESLRKYPKHFNALFTNLVDAGEDSGTLDVMLAKIATYQEKSESLRKKIKKAMMYPAAVVVIAFVVTIALLMYVVPQFQSLFKGFGADLPAMTQMVVNLSDLVQSYWWIMMGGIAIGISSFMWTIKHSEHAAFVVDGFLLKFPILGNILQKAAIARFCRTLGITYAAGLPLIDALKAVSGTTGNLLYKQATLSVRDQVETGQQIQSALRETKLFPNMVIQMVAIGEESGSLETMLSKVADFYEEEVDTAVDGLSSLIEPIIMSVLGVLIGGLVIAMYLPIFKLGSVV